MFSLSFCGMQHLSCIIKDTTQVESQSFLAPHHLQVCPSSSSTSHYLAWPFSADLHSFSNNSHLICHSVNYFSSPEQKAELFLFEICLLSVVVVSFSHFHLFPRTTRLISTKLGTKHFHGVSGLFK